MAAQSFANTGSGNTSGLLPNGLVIADLASVKSCVIHLRAIHLNSQDMND